MCPAVIGFYSKEMVKQGKFKRRGKRDSLGEADLQVGGQILAWGEGVLPDHHVGYIVDGEAKF